MHDCPHPAAHSLASLTQVAPFPYDLVMQAIEQYPRAELVWVQEEPINAGAWAYVQPRIDMAALQVAEMAADSGRGGEGVARQVRYVGGPPCAAPATGLRELHERELASVLESAIEVD